MDWSSVDMDKGYIWRFLLANFCHLRLTLEETEIYLPDAAARLEACETEANIINIPDMKDPKKALKLEICDDSKFLKYLRYHFQKLSPLTLLLSEDVSKTSHYYHFMDELVSIRRSTASILTRNEAGETRAAPHCLMGDCCVDMSI